MTSRKVNMKWTKRDKQMYNKGYAARQRRERKEQPDLKTKLKIVDKLYSYPHKVEPVKLGWFDRIFS